MTATIMASVALALSVVALCLAVLAYATTVGMQRSTHKVEWMPMPEPEPELPKKANRFDGVAQSLKDQIKEYAYPNMDEEHT